MVKELTHDSNKMGGLGLRYRVVAVELSTDEPGIWQLPPMLIGTPAVDTVRHIRDEAWRQVLPPPHNPAAIEPLKDKVLQEDGRSVHPQAFAHRDADLVIVVVDQEPSVLGTHGSPERVLNVVARPVDCPEMKVALRSRYVDNVLVRHYYIVAF